MRLLAEESKELLLWRSPFLEPPPEPPPHIDRQLSLLAGCAFRASGDDAFSVLLLLRCHSHGTALAFGVGLHNFVIQL